MKKCPACSVEMPEGRIVCAACLQAAVLAEPGHRRQRLARTGRGLMLAFAIFLFVKASWMSLAEANYAQFVAALGFAQKSTAVHYLGAMFAGLSAIGYVLAWIGSLLRRRWGKTVCGATLAVFAVGQVVTQCVGLAPEDPKAKAVALIVIWLALPILQFVALILGGEEAKLEA